LETLKPDDLATILYTSGTTGEPKGVMLSHRNLVSNAVATLEAFSMQADDLRLTWLPLSHIFARTCDLYGWIAAGSQLALAESRDTVLANCAELRPTLMNGVPYFFDKVRRVLCDKGLADVPGKLAETFGGRIRFLCSGGAALPDHVARFYLDRGVKLAQGYGLTESSPVISLSTETAFKVGTVGRAAPGVEIQIAGDGEVLCRGPNVMLGYWNKPQETAETIRDGWLHTGDLGELDLDGYLKITGRKKELIVTAGGKNVAPVLLESLLTEDPLIAQAIVIGDGRNYLTALIVPNFETLKHELSARGEQYTFPAEWLDKPLVRELFAERVKQRLEGLSSFEQVHKFTLLERPFAPESGELTPTLKLRRGVILERNGDLIEAMYRK
jgi:long-chain acyl-CoA synthetase